ncbi:hypothetical protein AB3S75_016111 [Citrus x aurantiifolia]
MWGKFKSSFVETSLKSALFKRLTVNSSYRDLSYNKDLRGPLPTTVGNLKKLPNLILVGCSFSRPIPDSIGSLQELVYMKGF